MTTPLNDELVGTNLGTPRRLTWSREDTVLYALAVGAGQADPARELEFSSDNTSFGHRVLPTFSATLSGKAAVPALLETLSGAVDPAAMLHGDQSHQLLGDFPAAGSAVASSVVTGVWDKGSAAVVEVQTELTDDETGELLSRSGLAMFFRGAGGWGGARGPSAIAEEIFDSSPDSLLTTSTRPDQPLLYRLTGDTNPLHTDPEFARRAGFQSPIVHGMCLYGIAGRLLLQSLSGSDPRGFTSLSARFSSVTTPGDDLTISVWDESAGTARFTMQNSQGRHVLTNGTFRYTPSATRA